MSKLSDTLRRRWADPDYRARQTETNRRTGQARSAELADPLKRKLHGQAIRNGKRLLKRWGKR